MRHHESANGELIVLHQCFEPLGPIFAESCFERLEDLCHIFLGIFDKPTKTISKRTAGMHREPKLTLAGSSLRESPRLCTGLYSLYLPHL